MLITTCTVQGFQSRKTPCPRPLIVKFYSLFKTQEPENHTLLSGTYPFRPNKGVPPPPGQKAQYWLLTIVFEIKSREGEKALGQSLLHAKHFFHCINHKTFKELLLREHTHTSTQVPTDFTRILRFSTRYQYFLIFRHLFEEILS